MNEYKLKGVNRVDTLDTYRKMTKNPDELYVVDELNEMFFGTITLPAAWLRGDVNHDGEVNGADALALQYSYNTVPTGSYTLQASDINSDNVINFADYVALDGTFANKVLAESNDLFGNWTMRSDFTVDTEQDWVYSYSVNFDIKASDKILVIPQKTITSAIIEVQEGSITVKIKLPPIEPVECFIVKIPNEFDSKIVNIGDFNNYLPIQNPEVKDKMIIDSYGVRGTYTGGSITLEDTDSSGNRIGDIFKVNTTGKYGPDGRLAERSFVTTKLNRSTAVNEDSTDSETDSSGNPTFRARGVALVAEANSSTVTSDTVPVGGIVWIYS